MAFPVKSNKIPTLSQLRHRNEEVEVAAKEAWYAKATVKNGRQMKMWRLGSKTALPVVAIGFIVSYFYFGLTQYYIE